MQSGVLLPCMILLCSGRLPSVLSWLSNVFRKQLSHGLLVVHLQLPHNKGMSALVQMHLLVQMGLWRAKAGESLHLEALYPV